MDITPLVKQGQQIIQSYAGGTFRINGQSYDGPVIVTTENTIPWRTASDFQNLSPADFGQLIDMAPDIDVVLLGCGAKMQFIDTGLKKSLKEQGFQIEIMDTGAACRTYNVLMADGRRVVAALLPA